MDWNMLQPREKPKIEKFYKKWHEDYFRTNCQYFNPLGEYIIRKYQLGYEVKTGYAIVPIDDSAYMKIKVKNAQKWNKYFYRSPFKERRMFNYQAIQGNATIFLVEGETDALSILSILHEANIHNISAVALGGFGGVRVERILRERGKLDNNFIVLTHKGTEIGLQDRLENIFQYHNSRYEIIDSDYFFQDHYKIWHILKKDKAFLRKQLLNLIHEIRKINIQYELNKKG